MDNYSGPAGLYDPRYEHDNCGIGAVVDIQGRKSHKTMDDALLLALETLAEDGRRHHGGL